MSRPASWLRDYRLGHLGTDALAGAALAALLIPESLGYAVVAGLPPQVGLFAAPLALVAYALLGGNRILVVATASAVSAVSASVVGSLAGGDTASFVALSAWLAIISGSVYLAVGFLRMGWIANFMSRAVIHGFIVGLAAFIIAGQLDGFVGVEGEGESALAKAGHVITNVGDWNIPTLVVGSASLGLLFVLHRVLPKVPAALPVMGLGMLAVAVLGVDELGVGVVGVLPTGLPSIGFPTVDGAVVLALVPGALAVTLVGFSEGFAAVRAYTPAGGKVDADRELIAFGAANVGAGLSSGMVVGASLSKTAAVDNAGGRTQMTNVVAAGIVVAALLFIGPLFAYLPEAALAAVVIHAVWGLIRIEVFHHLWRVDRFDAVVASMVLLGTLLLEPIYAVVLGVAVSLTHLVYRVSFPHRAELGVDPASSRAVDLSTHPDARPIPGVVVYRLDAPLIFANAEPFRQGLQEIVADRPDPVHRVVVDGEAIFGIDSTGMEVLGELVTELEQRGVEVHLARMRTAVLTQLAPSGLVASLGPDRLHERVEDALP
jgi:sulfate permease, SulP family